MNDHELQNLLKTAAEAREVPFSEALHERMLARVAEEAQRARPRIRRLSRSPKLHAQLCRGCVLAAIAMVWCGVWLYERDKGREEMVIPRPEHTAQAGPLDELLPWRGTVRATVELAGISEPLQMVKAELDLETAAITIPTGERLIAFYDASTEFLNEQVERLLEQP